MLLRTKLQDCPPLSFPKTAKRGTGKFRFPLGMRYIEAGSNRADPTEPVFIRRADNSDQSGERQPIDACRPLRLALEVTLQQTLQSLAVAGRIPSLRKALWISSGLIPTFNDQNPISYSYQQYEPKVIQSAVSKAYTAVKAPN